MKHPDLARRNARILNMHRNGSRPSDIAAHVRLNVKSVRRVLSSFGEKVDPAAHAWRDVSGEWLDESEDRRRARIIARAAAGARQRLAEIAREDSFGTSA